METLMNKIKSTKISVGNSGEYVTICSCPSRILFPYFHLSSPYLHNSTEVAVGGELQTLFLGPGLDVAELLPQDGPPVVTAQPRICVRHQLVEEPHVDEVEELREELDGQGGVDPTPPQ